MIDSVAERPIPHSPDVINVIYQMNLYTTYINDTQRSIARPPADHPQLVWVIPLVIHFIIPTIAFVSTPQWPDKVVTWAWLTSLEISAPFLSWSQALAVITSAMLLIM